MSPKARDILFKYGMPVAMVFLSFFLGRYSNNKQKIDEAVNEKLKNDIATAIMDKLLPVIDDKVTKEEFSVYKQNHDKQYDNDMQQVKQEQLDKYTILITAINKNSDKIDKSNKKIDDNFNKVIDAQNDIYQILIKK